MEFHVGDAVSLGVAFGPLNGLRNDFDADDMAGLSGHAQRYGARARIGIHHGIGGGELGKIDSGLIKPLGLRRVDLEKG